MLLTKWVNESIWISKVKIIYWPWSKVTEIQHLQTFFSLETARPMKPNFMWIIHGMGERKFVQMVQVIWPRWPPCPYMVKTLKNLLLWNQKADDLESWYAASGTRVLPNLLKWCPWVDVDLFYDKVKFGPLCFCMGKRKNNGFFRNYCSLYKIGRCSQLNEYMKLYSTKGQGHLLTVQITQIQYF